MEKRSSRVVTFDQEAGGRLEEDSVRLDRELVEGILQKFGVKQALMDVRTNVWGEGKLTQSPNGFTLNSDPFLTLTTSWDYPRGLLRKRSFIPITTTENVSVRVEVDLQYSEPSIFISDGERQSHIFNVAF